MRLILILALIAAAALSGCALTDKLLTNRIDVTLAMDECRVDSRWAGPGISTAIDPRDCETLLAALRLRIYLQMLEQQQGSSGSKL
jgi:hypothetical protein